MIRWCEHCGGPIPDELRGGVRFCSRRCSQGRGRPAERPRRGSVSLVELDRRLREREREVLARSRAA